MTGGSAVKAAHAACDAWLTWLSWLTRRAGPTWFIGRNGTRSIESSQQTGLSDLVQFAREHSPYYRKLHGKLAVPVNSLERLAQLPPVAKPELMAHFNDWTTDPAVTREGVETFMGDKRRVGRLYLDRYAVWTTSGVTGEPGIFLHDRRALAIYSALAAVRYWLPWATPRHFWEVMRRGGRLAAVLATGGHFAGVSYWERARISHPIFARRMRAFSALTPLPQLVEGLNRFQPAVLAGYPTAMALLAEERAAGRLDIRPILVATAGEYLAPAARAHIAQAFGCTVSDTYGASEFMYIAFDCPDGWLHVNSDWAILEPVDANYEPVPPGEPSHTVLLTNLANRVQPLIRYNLGDSITVRPDPCPCGNPLPAIRVEGRANDILRLRSAGGKIIPVLPLGLATVIEETPGVHTFQVIQSAARTLRVRLEPVRGADYEQVWENLASNLRDYLALQGLAGIRLLRAPEPPRRDARSGKFRQMWSEWSGV
jgi:phenylacetate-coenzyme A ligase PaaK-like adenylate-forming protein